MAAKQLKVATFNVNGVRSRLPHLLAWLEKEKPDIACLQELKSIDDGFPIDDIHSAGYGALWKGQRSWNGVAVLAKGVDPQRVVEISNWSTGAAGVVRVVRPA